MMTLRKKLVDAIIILTVTLAMFLGLECTVRAAQYVKGVLFPKPHIPSTILNQAWGRQHQSDEAGLSVRHVDYVEFRENPFRSQTITVDAEGRRPVPGNCERADAFTIWMFGGSTMFGYGAPDDSTIPAYLGRILNRGGRCAKIVNFGSGSWQSSQALIQLVESLKRVRPPNAVIFYDGINEIVFVRANAAPGGIDPSVKRLFDQVFRQQEVSAIDRITQKSALVRAVSYRIFKRRPNPRDEARLAVLANLSALAKAMVGLYAQNLRVVDALAREFGFSAYFFLQPYPQISKKKLTPTESDMLAGAPTDASGTDIFTIERNFYRAFGEETALKAHPRFFDISGIFDGLTGELFADDAHLLPEGNRIIAERFASEIVLPPLPK